MKYSALTVGKIRKAERILRRSDPVMNRLIVGCGPCLLADRESRPFHTLAVSIIGQQLSVKAADTIERRVADVVGLPFCPEGFVKAAKDSLRGAGLSKAKASYLQDIAGRAVDGRLDFDAFAPMSNEEVVGILTEIPGVGQWTAEMFLIFGLHRPDVFSTGDAGLKRAVRVLYGESEDAAALAIGWAPYRSVASWYLWRYLDVVG